MLSNYFNKNVKKIVLLLFILFVGTILLNTEIISKCLNLLSTGYTKEVKSVTFSSSGYSSNQAGSVFVQKSAEWTGVDEATINFVINTKPIEKRVYRDIIIVLDTSESMTEKRIEDMKESIGFLADDLFSNTNNSMAFITFNSTAKIESDFTRDKTVINNVLDKLEVKGATNYYLALKKVEELMQNYNRKDGTEVQMIFITDGYPTEGKGLYEAQYKLLKQKYPYLITNAIQYEMGYQIIENLESMSDYQFSSSISNSEYNGFNEILATAALTSFYYTSFDFSDTISEYFNVTSVDDITVPFGTIDIVTENGLQKVVWNVPKNKLKSGMTVRLSIKAKLKDKYVKKEAYYPTNANTTIIASAPEISNISVSSNLTPVLKSWYDITYNANVPDGCNIKFTKEDVGFPYHTQDIVSDELVCEGYQFKGWKVETDGVKTVNDNSFIMPAEDVNIGGTWTSLSIVKSMDGTINTRSTFYELLSEDAVMDDVKSEYVLYNNGINYNEGSSTSNGQGLYTLSSSKNSKYPILYYRGNITDNNVLFGGFCWKIVRTTDTGGIKLIYNGQPSGNKCTATTGSSTIATSSGMYNSATSDDVGSLAMIGYMYGKQYKTERMYISNDDWPDLLGIQSNSASTKYTVYASPSYSWNGSQYVVSNYISTTTPGNYPGYAYCYYTSPRNTCSEIKYVYTNGSVITLRNGETGSSLQAQANNIYWYYSNDVSYSNGVYTLQNPQRLKALDYGNNISKIKNGYHYTCMNSGTTCSSVNYFFSDDERNMKPNYITLTNGEKIEDAVANMITNSSNTTSSDIKKAVDSWYQSNMTSYTYMLEDTVWCNDRGISTDEQYAGWLKDGNSTEYLHFNGAKNSTNSFILNEESTCSSNDKLTVSSGRLDYPVGLITVNEARFAGAKYETKNTSYYLYNGQDYWTMTPNRFNNTIPYINLILSTGSVFRPLSSGTSSKSLSQSYGIRPMVSLKPGVFLTDGDGTSTNPYVIEME